MRRDVERVDTVGVETVENQPNDVGLNTSIFYTLRAVAFDSTLDLLAEWGKKYAWKP